MSGYLYVRDEDIEEYWQFCLHHSRAFGRALPTELWHYTNADGLIGILKSGKIWTTQVTCLNDILEQRLFGDLVHEAVKERRKQNTDPIMEPLFRAADELLANRDFTIDSQFVACFSETEDDLGQWRGYGGGECGYALAFRSQGIIDALKCRGSGSLLPMGYAGDIHSFVVTDVMRCAEIYYRSGLARSLPAEQWAREFVAAFGNALNYIAALVKHPKFLSEAERRISMNLRPGEYDQLEFRQKRTLLARHLPVDLASETDGVRRLPITRICVGPGPSLGQKATRIAVADLLLQCGYQNIPVELSCVPYRVP
jgi:hypothetical protein